jgi:recombination protein RecA
MSQALRKLTSIIGRSRCACIFINQIREKIGIMFGNPETTTGGRALKFYSSCRLDIRRVSTLKDNDGNSNGIRAKVKVVKNKVAAPFQEAEFDIMYDEGISYEGTLVDVATGMDIIQKRGAWFSFGDQRLAQGRDAVKEYLKNDPEFAAKIEGLIREKYGLLKGSLPEQEAPAKEGKK